MPEESASNPRVVGVCYHPGEFVLSSFSFLIPAFQGALEEHFEVRVLPQYLYHLSRSRRQRALEQLVSEVDVLFLWIPRYPSFLQEIFQARDAAAPHVPILYLSHGEMPLGGGWLRPCVELLRPIDTVLFNCTPDRRIFELLVAETAASVEMFPFFIDTDRFAATRIVERQRTREDFGFAPQDLVFLFTGRITPEKNVHAILHLFSFLGNRHPDLRLLIVGPVEDVPFLSHSTARGNLWRQLHDLVQSSGVLREIVKFVPERLGLDLMPSLYAAADAFINLTLHHSENFGLVNVEAMSCGLPVVVSDWGGLRDTVPHGRTGFRVPTYRGEFGEHVDLHRAASYCAEIIGSADRRAELGEAGRQWVCERYSVTGLGERLSDLLIRKSAPEDTGARKNRLTAFGARFYSELFEPEATETSLPQYEADQIGLYKELVLPYCTSELSTEIDEHSVFFLTSPFVSAQGQRLVIEDPVWPDKQVVDELERKIVERLQRAVFVPFREIAHLCGDEHRGSETMRSLMRRSIVAQSRCE